MEQNNAIELHFIPTTKFKDVGIYIRFLNQLQPFQASCRSLLGLMMIDRCTRYETKAKMSAKLDSLYGATLQAQTIGYGQAQALEIRSRFINPKFLKDGKSLLEEIVKLLHEVIFSPCLTPAVFEENKAILAAKLKRVQEEPADYVISQGLKLAGEGLPLQISALGELEDLDKIGLEDIKQAYETLIHEDHIDVFVCGDVEEEYVTNVFEQYFSFEGKRQMPLTYYAAENDLEMKQVEEQKEVPQASLMMTFFTHTPLVSDAYMKLRVANALLGQYSTSFLFQEVREKHSLCYSIFSNLISYDGVLGITGGIEKEKIDEAISLILKQVDKVKQGAFSDEHLEVSKKMIINGLKASNDVMNSLVALQYQNVLCQRNQSVEKMIEEIQSVTRDDVMSVFQAIECKGIFIVNQREAEDEKGCE